MMKELDELKESIDSLEKSLEGTRSLRETERALLSDCFAGVVKVLEKLAEEKA